MQIPLRFTDRGGVCLGLIVISAELEGIYEWKELYAADDIHIHGSDTDISGHLLADLTV